MKKSLVLAAVSAALLSPIASADTLLGLYVGGQAWQQSTDGGFANDNNLVNFNFDKKTKGSFYVALEHPIPLLPNVRVRRSDMANDGLVTLSSQFTFNGETFAADTDLMSSLDMSNTDYTLYYELFDNDLFSFDAGLTLKDIDGEIYAESQDDPTQKADETFSGFVPLVYAHAKFGVPGTGFGAYALGNFLSFDGHSMTEYEVALTYDVLDNIAVDMTLQLGYRSFNMELNDLDGIYTNLDFTGPFAGVEIHF